MNHSEDAYTSLLLTLPLTRNTDEMIVPLSGKEFDHIMRHLDGAPLSSLNGASIGKLCRMFSMTESEAYRLCILLDREVLLMRVLDECITRDIDVICPMDPQYPSALKARYGGFAAPPLFFFGAYEMLNIPSVGIIGTSGIKTPEMFKHNIKTLIPELFNNGITLCVNGDPGACYHARCLAAEIGSPRIVVMNGGMADYVADEKNLIAAGSALELAVSPLNPFAAYNPEAQSVINRLIYSQSLASFVATLPPKSTEADALRKRYCPYLYAFDTPENAALISKGFSPADNITPEWVKAKSEIWLSSQAEQLSFL